MPRLGVGQGQGAKACKTSDEETGDYKFMICVLFIGM